MDGVIWAIHGFLGRGSDWDFLPFPHYAPSLFCGDSLAGLRDAEPDDILLGYSMGGRLALRILAEKRFRKAVIVSAGISHQDETRRAADEEWARRFESEEWTSLMEAWNAQPVFGGHVVERREEHYSRAALARALRDWSPSVLAPVDLTRIETPILWVAGERDTKFVEEGKRAVALLPHAELWICPGAGHRVPWEQREAFVRRLRAFIE
ncbi:MAG TPA: alpha/beta fold hydrolase [Thermoanaerobaculia bacterium]|jgi:2-succinyl-6-hydroxy-2,4-cyclohexadiene-1-carboxylate synthase